MRRIALLNQKGGVGKTTTAVNLGAALARAGRRVVLIDLDPQGNLSTHLGLEVERGAPSSYGLLAGTHSMAEALYPTEHKGLRVVPTTIDLSGADLELATVEGRESVLKGVLDAWQAEELARHGVEPAEYVLLDCPPALGLLSINALVACREVFVALQTQFLALQGMTRLLEVVQLIRAELNPELNVTGIIPCQYDSRLRLAREVLAELRQYFPTQCFRRAIANNVKLAEAPSFGQSIFTYAPDSNGARDYTELGEEVIEQEKRGAVGLEPEHTLTPATPAVDHPGEGTSAADGAQSAPDAAPGVGASE